MEMTGVVVVWDAAEDPARLIWFCFISFLSRQIGSCPRRSENHTKAIRAGSL